VAAEGLCEMVHRTEGLPCLVLRTSRFFPEADDRAEIRHAYADGNVKVNELLYRRVDLEDVVSAHLLALERAAAIGFGRYVISATTPFTRDELMAPRASAVVAGPFRRTPRSTPLATGGCSPASSASTSTRRPVTRSAGVPATTSAPRSPGSRPARRR